MSRGHLEVAERGAGLVRGIKKFLFDDALRVESATGHGNWRIYGIDDVARRLADIAKTLEGFTGFRRLKVETYDAQDRSEEERSREEWLDRQMRHHGSDSDENG